MSKLGSHNDRRVYNMRKTVVLIYDNIVDFPYVDSFVPVWEKPKQGTKLLFVFLITTKVMEIISELLNKCLLYIFHKT